MSDLLTAVDALTLPSVVKVKQSDSDREWTTECRQVPLLVQLEAAVAGGIGSHAGSSPARERMPIDAGALELMGQIEGVVSGWYWSVPNVRLKVDLSTRLRVWYVHHANQVRAGKIGAADDVKTTRMVEGWVSKIRGTFDPVIRLDFYELVDGKPMPVACPIEECGARYAFDPKTGDRIIAVVLEYRDLGAETIDKAVGRCRACEHEWAGGYGVRELAYYLDSRTRREAA